MTDAVSNEVDVLARDLVDLLRSRGELLATAESLTGGQLAAALTAVPGASAVYRGGVVAYASAIKVAVLGVPVEVVDQHGVVSAECARAMAVGAARLLGATHALATTGVAGPDPQEGHPVGTVHVGLHSPAGTTSYPLALSGTRAVVQHETCRAALGALRAALSASGGILGREDRPLG